MFIFHSFLLHGSGPFDQTFFITPILIEQKSYHILCNILAFSHIMDLRISEKEIRVCFGLNVRECGGKSLSKVGTKFKTFENELLSYLLSCTCNDMTDLIFCSIRDSFLPRNLDRSICCVELHEECSA